MDETSLNRIAIALEKIATLMENSEQREINTQRKVRIEESKAAKKAALSEAKKQIRSKIADSKNTK